MKSETSPLLLGKCATMSDVPIWVRHTARGDYWHTVSCEHRAEGVVLIQQQIVTEEVGQAFKLALEFGALAAFCVLVPCAVVALYVFDFAAAAVTAIGVALAIFCAREAVCDVIVGRGRRGATRLVRFSPMTQTASFEYASGGRGRGYVSEPLIGSVEKCAIRYNRNEAGAHPWLESEVWAFVAPDLEEWQHELWAPLAHGSAPLSRLLGSMWDGVRVGERPLEMKTRVHRIIAWEEVRR